MICDNYYGVINMEKYRKSAHATYRCEFHFVWVPKYRYKVLIDDVKSRLKEILYNLCEWNGIILIEGSVCDDHIHLYLSVPPKFSPSYVMKILKGRSAEILMKEFPKLRKKYWGMHLWARGYFVDTIGINRETIKKYIRQQEETQFRELQLRIWRDS